MQSIHGMAIPSGAEKKLWIAKNGCFSNSQSISSPIDRSALEIDVTGTHVSGEKLKFSLAAFFEIKNGKIHKARDYYDKLDLARQLAKGWLLKQIVNRIIRRTDKGLY